MSNFPLDIKKQNKLSNVKRDYFRLIRNYKSLTEINLKKNLFISDLNKKNLRNKFKKNFFDKSKVLVNELQKKKKDDDKIGVKGLRFFRYFLRKSYFIKKIILRKEILELQPFINELKVNIKFQFFFKDFFFFCKVYFKYTGSNIFATLTSNKGDVVFSYSAGIFKNLRTRKEKTTVLVAQQLGQLLSLRIYKTNARYLCFIPYLNNRKMRSLIHSTIYGLNYITLVKISFIFIKRKVIRNGVRLRKMPRK